MLGNKLSRVGVGVGGGGGWVAGLTENKTKPSSWGLAELGNKSLLSEVPVGRHSGPISTFLILSVDCRSSRIPLCFQKTLAISFTVGFFMRYRLMRHLREISEPGL